MFRHTIAVVAVICSVAGGAQAQSAAGFFEARDHDFGSVPRGPLLTHYYRFTNTSAAPLHISGIRVSCGCVTATALQSTVQPGETAAIHATMDTRRFSGSKQVTIFVTFDRPHWEEVALNIRAYGRDDLSLEGEGLGFGTVARGATGAARMTVTLRQPNWIIQGAASGSEFVAPKVKEVRRSQFEAVYEVAADLKPGLPVGRWTTDVYLTTNSPVAPQIRIPATVEVAPTLSVSPGEVTFAPTQVGQPSETKLLVRGGQPFKIKEIVGTDASLVATTTGADAKPVHIITVKFDPKQPGDVIRKLKIVTDLPTEGVAEVVVRANAERKAP